MLQKEDCTCAPLPVSIKKLTVMLGVPVGALNILSGVLLC